jgi:DNA-binding transcriptional regulator LsrR (DeoR family)
VQRLLEGARWSGVVDIHIEAPPWLHLDLETQLRETFGLSDTIVSPSRTDQQSQREAVARSAASYLERRLHDGAVVAVSHGRDTGEVPHFFRPERRPHCTFVSATGGSSRVDAPTDPNEICRALAERCGGRAESLDALAYVESAEMRNRLFEQEAVAHTLRVAAQASVALVGIGGTEDVFDGVTLMRGRDGNRLARERGRHDRAQVGREV